MGQKIESRDLWVGRFEAMGCGGEILLDTQDAALGARQLEIAVREANRIEQKYSRYRAGTLIQRINTSAGLAVEVDEETAALLDYADQCFTLSDGLFDITTGVLRRVWHFNGGAAKPSPDAVAAARALIGWDKVSWKRPWIRLPAGFEIDFGGIGKEYAVDRILALLRARAPISTLVNLGGDIAAAGDRRWTVGIESVDPAAGLAGALRLRQGALATSGTTKRFTTVNGELLGHILNPKTGWPVRQAPRSLTVAAATCTEAGFWSTLGMLHGAEAESFLGKQSLEFRCYRASPPPSPVVAGRESLSYVHNG